MVKFTGYLPQLTKADLQAIAKEAVIPYEDATRAELLELVRRTLQDDSELYHDERFAGLSGVIIRQRKSMGHEGSPPKSPEPKERKISRSRNGTDASPVKQLQDRLQEAVSKVVNDAYEASSQLANVTDRQLAIARRVEARHVSKTVAIWAHRAERQLGQTARKAQSTLSNGWSLVILTLVLELLFVVAASIPLAKQVSFGPFEWWSMPWTADSAFTLTLPDLLVLRQFDTIEPIALWIFSSIVVPLCAAHLVVFPRPEQSKHHRSSKDRYLLGLHRPSALSFSIVRLAVNFYLNEVASSPLLSFPSDIINRFGNFQLLVSAVAVAFNTYELLAG